MLLGLQHASFFIISLIVPIIVIKQAGSVVDDHTARSFISMSMIAGGLTTILQSMRKGPLGSGYLCPAVCGPSYLTASIIAVKTGGLSLLFGMTALAGILEVAFAALLRRLRVLFPPEVVGIVVMLVGMVVIRISVENFVGISHGMGDKTSTLPKVAVGVLTLLSMITISVWSKGTMRLYSALIGIVIGYIISYVFGIVAQSHIDTIFHARFFALPYISSLGWSIDYSVIVPFVIATICSSLKTVGDLITCQKINDADWRRADMKNVAKGVAADGFGGIIPGLLGGYGQSTSSSNIGMSIATGATSRRIAWYCGGIIITMALMPKFAQVLVIMPPPVMGATLIFSVSFMIVAGLQILMSRMLDARRTFIVGISIIFGLSADIMPEVYSGIHGWIKPIFDSSLALGTITAIMLNLVLRLGVANKVTLKLTADGRHPDLVNGFMHRNGGAWGARPEVIYNATAAINEAMEAIFMLNPRDQHVTLTAMFDEFNLDVNMNFHAPPFKIPSARPSPSELREDEDAAVKLSGYIVSQYADKVTATVKDGITTLHMHFEH
ncbi:MAG: purine/pyrimidine permease [Candidatus Sumerlaeota bacterium]|nr:purine/pyrimidine permease [Candidatus Sumerlaeota bacterium]